MGRKVATLVFLVLFNSVLINSEDEIGTDLPRFWTTTTQTATMEGEDSTAGLKDEDTGSSLNTDGRNSENNRGPQPTAMGVERIGEESTEAFADGNTDDRDLEASTVSEKPEPEATTNQEDESKVIIVDENTVTSSYRDGKNPEVSPWIDGTTNGPGIDQKDITTLEQDSDLEASTLMATNTDSDTTESNDVTTLQTFVRGSLDCSAYIIGMLGVGPVVVCAIGLVGNVMCILVFWGDRNKSATHTLLLLLAITDSTVLVSWAVMLMSQTLYFYSENNDPEFLNVFPYVRKYGWGIANVCQMVACWLVVVITAQRYIAVCHPHKMRFLGKPKIALIIFAIVLIICVPFNLMRWLEYDVVVQDGKVSMTLSKIGANGAYQIYFKGIAYYFLIFIAPVSLLLFFTVALIIQLGKTKRNAKVQPAPNAVTEAGKKAKKTSTDEITFALIVVDIVFIVCQTVNPLRRLLDLLEFDYRSCDTWYTYVRPMSGIIIVFNSAINFVVFCLCAKGFRGQVLERVCGRKAGTEGGSSVTTRQTTVAPAAEK